MVGDLRCFRLCLTVSLILLAVCWGAKATCQVPVISSERNSSLADVCSLAGIVAADETPPAQRRSAAVKILLKAPFSDAAYYATVGSLGFRGCMWTDFGSSDQACVLGAERWLDSASGREYLARCLLASELMASVIRNGDAERADRDGRLRKRIEKGLDKFDEEDNLFPLAAVARLHLSLSDLYRAADEGEITAEDDYWDRLREESLKCVSEAVDGKDYIRPLIWCKSLAMRAVLLSHSALRKSAEKHGWQIKRNYLDVALTYLDRTPNKLRENYKCSEAPPTWIMARYNVMKFARMTSRQETVIEMGLFVTSHEDLLSTAILEDAWEETGWAYFQIGEFQQAMECYAKAKALNPGDMDLSGKISVCKEAICKSESASVSPSEGNPVTEAVRSCLSRGKQIILNSRSRGAPDKSLK